MGAARQKTHACGAVPCHVVQGQGEPLLLTMGLGGAKEAWPFQTNAFRRHCRAITFDNRDVSQTGVEQAAITVEVMAGDAIALLDHLGIDSRELLDFLNKN